MKLLASRVRDRSTEVAEWIDYRRDAGLWPFLILPPLLSVAWAYGGLVGLGIVVAFATVVSLLAVGALVLAIVAWVAGGAISDSLVSVSLRDAQGEPISVRTIVTTR